MDSTTTDGAQTNLIQLICDADRRAKKPHIHTLAQHLSIGDIENLARTGQFFGGAA